MAFSQFTDNRICRFCSGPGPANSFTHQVDKRSSYSPSESIPADINTFSGTLLVTTEKLSQHFMTTNLASGYNKLKSRQFCSKLTQRRDSRTCSDTGDRRLKLWAIMLSQASRKPSGWAITTSTIPKGK